MNEEKLEVIVDQKPGIIHWNFEQLKTALAEKMQEYKGLVYTEETVPVAKADVATLRKLKKSVSDKRIEIKKKCLEPYEVIEAQAAELTKLLDEPINEIAKQLDDYEKKRKAEIKKEIVAYMTEKFSPLPVDISKKLQFSIYDDRWENVSVAKRTWKMAINEAFGRTQGDLAVLDEIEDEFKEKAMAVYSRNLVLAEAMSKVTELRRQKEEILAAEAKRREAEELAKKVAEKAEEKPQPEEATIPRPEVESAPVKPTEPQNNAGWVEGAMPEPQEEAIFINLRIKATPSQIAKIKGYIEYTGAVYREV